MNTLNCQVRIHKGSNTLYMFFIDEYKTVCCFCFEEGHNEACNSYRLKCKPVPTEVAKPFIAKVQAYYDSIPDDSKLILKLVKRMGELT